MKRVYVLLGLAVLARAETFNGILVDAGCRDRATVNLRRGPQRDIPSAPGGEEPDRRHTAEAERSGAMAQQTRDALARMPATSCAVTAGTRNYALFTDKGRLLTFDEGGNTFAGAAMATFEEGRRMEDGSGPPVKPRVEVTGSIRGDQINVTALAVKH